MDVQRVFENALWKKDFPKAMRAFDKMEESTRRIVMNTPLKFATPLALWVMPLSRFSESASLAHISTVIPYVEDINIYDNDFAGFNPLLNAIVARRVPVVKLLLENGADPNSKPLGDDTVSAVLIALGSQLFNIFDLLLVYHPDLDYKGKFGDVAKNAHHLIANTLDKQPLTSSINYLLSTNKMTTEIANMYFDSILRLRDQDLIISLLQKIRPYVNKKTFKVTSTEVLAYLVTEDLFDVNMPHPYIEGHIFLCHVNAVKIVAALGICITNVYNLFEHMTLSEDTYDVFELLIAAAPLNSDTYDHIFCLLNELTMMKDGEDDHLLDPIRTLLSMFSHKSDLINWGNYGDNDCMPSLKWMSHIHLRQYALKSQLDQMRSRIEQARLSKNWQSLLK
jgi:hypothetical protein